MRPDQASPTVRRRRFQLGCFGVFGSGNFGNDATLDVCLSGVRPRVPTPRILCVAADPDKVGARYGIASFPITATPVRATWPAQRVLRVALRGSDELRELRRARRLLRDVRTFIIAGTGVLDDQHVRPSQLPLEVFRWSVAARLAGARLVFLAVGAGPIHHPWSRTLLTRAVRLGHEVSYRDQRSLEYMQNLGCDVRSHRVLPDLALAARPRDSFRTAQEVRAPRITIGVLGRVNWHGREAAYRVYEDRIVQVVVRLARDGWCVRLVKGDEVDADTEQAILRRPEVAGLPVEAADAHSFADVVDAVAGCRGMIASRYHSLVAAVVVGIPVISLGYGPKNAALLDQLGVGRWGHDIDAFSVDEVLRQIADAARHDAPLYRPQLQQYRDILQREFEALADE